MTHTPILTLLIPKYTWVKLNRTNISKTLNTDTRSTNNYESLESYRLCSLELKLPIQYLYSIIPIYDRYIKTKNYQYYTIAISLYRPLSLK